MIAANTRRRQIGGIGTAARVVLGLAFLLLGVTGGRVSVMHGQVGIGFELPAPDTDVAPNCTQSELSAGTA